VYEGKEIAGLLDNVGITAQTLPSFTKVFDALTEPTSKDEEPANKASLMSGLVSR
jgi:hypothetical protein